jgi:hypothetical protein
VRKRSNTNKRTAEERLLCWRALSMSATNFDTVTPCVFAISFRLFQNASSRLTLVLCPLKTTDRLTINDFINASQEKFASIIWRFGVATSSKKYLFKKIVSRCGIEVKLVVQQHLSAVRR